MIAFWFRSVKLPRGRGGGGLRCILGLLRYPVIGLDSSHFGLASLRRFDSFCVLDLLRFVSFCIRCLAFGLPFATLRFVLGFGSFRIPSHPFPLDMR